MEYTKLLNLANDTIDALEQELVIAESNANVTPMAMETFVFDYVNENANGIMKQALSAWHAYEMGGVCGMNCPVCGKGEYVHSGVLSSHVSHMACVFKASEYSMLMKERYQEAEMVAEQAEAIIAEVKMYGAANGELKDALFDAHKAITSAEKVVLEQRSELAALKEDFKHLHSRWDYTQYWFANLYPVDWDRCQEKYNTTKTGARAEEGGGE